MYVGLKQPRGDWERYVTPARAAAKETTLYSPRKVKIREITTHEPSSFLKRGHKLPSIRTIRVDSIELTTFSTHLQSPDQLYFLIVNSRFIGVTRTSISVTGTGL